MRAPSTDGRPTVVTVDREALTANYRAVRMRAGDRKVLAIVKAQAYGHGAVEVSRHLIGLGAGMLGVALVEEARELREAGIDAPILVMGAVFPEQADEIVRLGIATTLWTLPVARALSTAAAARGVSASVHVKVDTGMGRVGLPPEDAEGLCTEIGRLRGLRLEGLMTHFADADLRDKRFAGLQAERFERLVSDLGRAGLDVPLRHAANSAAVLELPRALFTMVRPGLMLYGYDPLESGSGAGLRPALSLSTRIAFLKRVPAGTPISYGRTFVTQRESIIATIPIGYADGYDRGLSNRGEALVGGRRVPVAGRVCMDMTMLDVTDVPGVSEGGEAVLIGEQGNERITAADIAAWTGTIPYEVLCGISSRVPRVYIN